MSSTGSSPNGISSPLHPKLRSVEARTETFKFWPKSTIVKPWDLAMAGFFYKGEGMSILGEKYQNYNYTRL